MTGPNPGERSPSPARAVEVFITWQEQGAPGEIEDLLSEHEELRPWLEPLVRGENTPLPENKLPSDAPEQVSDTEPEFDFELDLGPLPERPLETLPLPELEEPEPEEIAAPVPPPVRRLQTHCSLQTILQSLRAYVGDKRDGNAVREAFRGAIPGNATADHDHTVAALLVNLAQRLQELHGSDTRHGDLRPENVFVEADGSIELSPPTAETSLAPLEQSPCYAAPEQLSARAGRVDQRSDLFALGILAYELIGPQHPFESASRTGTVARVLRGRAPALDTSPALARIVAKCLAVDPDRRYASAQDISDDLEAFSEGRPIRAPRTDLASRVLLKLRHTPRSTIALEVVMVLLLIGLIVALNAYGTAIEQTETFHQNTTQLIERLDAESKSREALDTELEEARAELTAVEAENNRLSSSQQSSERKLETKGTDLKRATDGLAHEQASHTATQTRNETLKGTVKSLEAKLVRAGKTNRDRVAELTIARDEANKALSTERTDHSRSKHALADATTTRDSASATAAGAKKAQRTTLDALAKLKLSQAELSRDHDLAKLDSARLTRLEVLDDITRLGVAERAAERLFAQWPRQERALETWMAELGEPVASTLPELQEILVELLSAKDKPVFSKRLDSYLRTTLPRAIESFHEFSNSKIGTLAKLRRELDWARSVRAKSISEQRAVWNRVIDAIAKDPRFKGAELTPQLGLVPLGPDPQSGLQEFVHLRSGVPGHAIPKRTQAGLVTSHETGIVFVLLPGGETIVGAQTDAATESHYDPDAYADETPTTKVTVRPVLVAKHELTQGQWSRLGGPDQSHYRPGVSYGDTVVGLRHPVENASRDTCLVILRGHGLDLPSEAEWEYAARAGTDTAWSTGMDLESIQGFANLADQSAAEHAPHWERFEAWDDTRWTTASVGMYQPNAFGLHDTIGNVWEWCRDNRQDKQESSEDAAIARGGSYFSPAINARAAIRFGCQPSFVSETHGLRPIRELR